MSVEEEPSQAAGACVLVALGGGATAIVFAVSPDVGVLTLWVVGAVALWRSARRVSDSSATPPPEGVTPSEGEEAGHSDVPQTRVERRSGMLIMHDLSERHRYDVVDGEVKQR